MLWILSAALLLGAKSLELPGSCTLNQYYNPALLSCEICPANSSLVKSSDGFSCTCDDHSIPSGPGQCRPCSVTEVVSTDGMTCVTRKCQNISGRVACRKCPNDYISVTQNFDGSPMKEVQCIKCARGFKPQANTCVRCESCTCSKAQVVVRGTCVPKTYVNGRTTYTEKLLHPLELLDIVKHEYLCTKNDSKMCLNLANECVKNFYTSDLGGPCRLWLLPKFAPKGLPPLLVNDKIPGDMGLPRGERTFKIAVLAFTTTGGIVFSDNENEKNPCLLPLVITIGNDFTSDCTFNLSKFGLSSMNETLLPYALIDEEFIPLPVSLMKPNGFYVQKGSWSNSSFSRYFIVHRSLSTTSNATSIVYLRKMSVRVRLQRDSNANGSLNLSISMEVQYATTERQDTVTITLKVEHVMPSAGIVRGLEIWSSVLGVFLTLYALVQWRGVLRRGAPHYSLLPLLAGAAADTLYFAAFLVVLHALAAEAGTLGLTLPVSNTEEKIIRDFLFSAFSLKILKVIWINWRQCTCDIFLINWAEYNPPVTKDFSTPINESWKATALAREWSLLQTNRRTCPGFTVSGTLLLLRFMAPLQSRFPRSQAYNWALASVAWWSSYSTVLVTNWLVEKFVTSSVNELPKICTRVGLSLMVFQEEYYAHYVHGRNDDFHEVRSMAGPLATCRVACVPQLRAVCRQLSTPASGVLNEAESRQSLLSKFLAAFFERALEGLNWVASERSLFERLFDVEVSSREAGGTSALLYDDDATPSCFNMTWWGEEWVLSTFDAMLFSCVLIWSEDSLLAALVTILMWQITKLIRTWLGNRNQMLKTGVDIQLQ